MTVPVWVFIVFIGIVFSAYMTIRHASIEESNRQDKSSKKRNT